MGNRSSEFLAWRGEVRPVDLSDYPAFANIRWPGCGSLHVIQKSTGPKKAHAPRVLRTIHIIKPSTIVRFFMKKCMEILQPDMMNELRVSFMAGGGGCAKERKM